MNRMTIGFDRRIDIEWLDAAASRFGAGQTPTEVRAFLWTLLQDIVAGDTVHSARGKTLTVLMRIWVTVPQEVVPLRDAAASNISSISAEERMAIHWLMSVASYPFFADVASHTGKLMALNGQANLSQIIRKMIERWGDRSTLSIAVQRVLRSMVQWKAIQIGSEKGSFVPQPKHIPLNSQVSELAIQSLLLSFGREMSLKQALSHSAMFPFNIKTSMPILRNSKHLNVFNNGDQHEFVELITR